MRVEYALLAYFDEETELNLKQLWIELHERGLTDYGIVVKDRRPHLTLADYQALDVEQIIPLLNDYFKKQEKLPLTFHGLGSFMGRNMIYLAPTINKQLLAFHENYHEEFKCFDQNPDSYYVPKNWVPHCSLAGRLTDETMLQTFEFLKNKLSPIQTNIAEVGLVEVVFDADGNIVKDKLLFLKQLN